MNPNFLEFEQPIAELENQIAKLKLVGSDSQIDFDISEEILRLEKKSKELTHTIFKNLNAWQIAQLARHPSRPYTLDYISEIFTEYDDLQGDRAYGADAAIVGGIARLGSKPVMVVGQQKGRDTKEKIKRNFGMVHPEGYRKAKRLFELAEKFSLPVITFIDTPGAYPGIDAESRGQSEAIARNLFVMAQLRTPIINVVIGEGCSGGALGIGVGDKVLMLQYSYYATISPEGCATILFKSATKAEQAAEIMGITAPRLLDLGLIDTIISEPLGGAHRDPKGMAQRLKARLIEELNHLSHLDIDTLLDNRYQRLMSFGNQLSTTETK